MADLIVKGGTVVTVDGAGRIIEDGAIVISGDRIEFVGPREEAERKYGAERTLDAGGKFIFPGFVNAHTHMFQVLLRNLAVDMVLLEWLKRVIHPALLKFEEDDVYVGALLGCRPILSVDAVERTLDEKLTGKKRALLELNCKALRRGLAVAEDIRLEAVPPAS